MRYDLSPIMPVLLAASLVACGQGGVTAENAEATETAAAADVADAAAKAEATEIAGIETAAGVASDAADDAGTATAEAAAAGAAPAASAAPAAGTAAAAPAKTLAALPLKRGYYVSSDTPCGQASNATVVLVHRKGINSSQSQCEYKKIEQTGPNMYRVQEACTEMLGNAPPEEFERTFTLTGDTAFTAVSQGDGWVQNARYCAQSSMPELWRENDISSVID